MRTLRPVGSPRVLGVSGVNSNIAQRLAWESNERKPTKHNIEMSKNPPPAGAGTSHKANISQPCIIRIGE